MEKDRIEHRGLRLAQVYFGMTSSQQLYFAHNCDELSRLILSLQEMGENFTWWGNVQLGEIRKLNSGYRSSQTL